MVPELTELDSLNTEMKRIIVEEESFTDADYPFTIKPNFLTLRSIIEISPPEPIVSFASYDIIRNFSGFYETLFY